MNQRTLARLFFAVTMIAIGMVGVAGGGFAPIWRPVPHGFPARDLLAYLSTLVSLVTGVGLLVKRTAAASALILFLVFLAWVILFKGPFVLQAPLVEGTYQSIGENLVWVAAAWLIYGWSVEPNSKWNLGMLSGPVGQHAAYVLYGLALVAFGFSHFAYLELTAPLVPQWMQAPVFWAYLTGSIYLLSGFALLSVAAARAGAALAAINITLITLLVWGPMVLSGELSAMHWQETVVSTAIMASAWVIAASLADRRWIAVSGSRPATRPRPLPSR
jgi:uncharacterized membrane protein